MLGIDDNLVVFDFQKMELANNVKTYDIVHHIDRVNNDTFLTGGIRGYLELITKKDLLCLSLL